MDTITTYTEKTLAAEAKYIRSLYKGKEEIICQTCHKRMPWQPYKLIVNDCGVTMQVVWGCPEHTQASFTHNHAL